MTRRLMLGAVGIGALWFTCRESHGVGKVEVRWRLIIYTEPAGDIELVWEPQVGGSPRIAYIPSPRRWRDEMEDWARDRREEIFADIREQTSHMNFTWHEYD
jgi:hypothetical protein